MHGILAPGFDQPLVFIPSTPKGKGKKKRPPPDFDTGLDGLGHKNDGGLCAQLVPPEKQVLQ